MEELLKRPLKARLFALLQRLCLLWFTPVLPPSVAQLYRDSLRLATYLARKQGVPPEALKGEVRAVYRRSAAVTDEATVLKLRTACVRIMFDSNAVKFAHAVSRPLGSAVTALHNFLMHEAQQAVREGKDPFEGET